MVCVLQALLGHAVKCPSPPRLPKLHRTILCIRIYVTPIISTRLSPYTYGTPLYDIPEDHVYSNHGALGDWCKEETLRGGEREKKHLHLSLYSCNFTAPATINHRRAHCACINDHPSKYLNLLNNTQRSLPTYGYDVYFPQWPL